jgi:hypothetical protein
VARAQDVDPIDDDDAEALSWAGDEEQGRAAPRLRSPEAAAPEAGVVDERAEAPGSVGRRVAVVVFAVPYLALAVGWIFAVQFYSSPSDLFAGILWQFGEFLTMLVAPLWFAATLSLTREARPLVRVGWLALGLLVVLPWPVLIRFLAALQVTGGLS